LDVEEDEMRWKKKINKKKCFMIKILLIMPSKLVGPQRFGQLASISSCLRLSGHFMLLFEIEFILNILLRK